MQPRNIALQRVTTYADGVATPKALNSASNFSNAAMVMIAMAAKFMLSSVLSAVRMCTDSIALYMFTEASAGPIHS